MKWTPKAQILFSSKGTARPVPADLVSVCVTTYNYEKYIIDCLQSVSAQCHKNLELIVVDDASHDDDTCKTTKEWMELNQHRFYRVRLLVNSRNQGPSATRNAGFECADSDFVFLLDADNEIYPRAIREMYAVARDGRFDAVYSQLEFFGIETHLGYADIYDPDMLRQGNYIDAMALISKKAWQEVGGFSHLELGWEDYDFWLKFQDAGFAIGFIPEILCRYRTHGKSRTDIDAVPSHEKLSLIMSLRHPFST
jgi:glycosyltransferase involved in cell wall biosynthesis